MSRNKAIATGMKHLLDPDNRDEYVPTLNNVLGRTYDAGFIEGSGQSSITALEREVIVAALEWMHDHRSPNLSNKRLTEASYALEQALEREAGE